MSDVRLAKPGPFAPKGATPETLWLLQATIDGAGFGNIAYGALLTIFIMTIPLLWSGRKTHPRYTYSMMVYVWTVFALATIANFANMNWVERQFVDEVNIPGGPVAFTIRSQNYKLVCVVIGTWLQDGMVIWRFSVMYGHRWWLTIWPCITFLASIILSCVTLWGLTHPGATWLSLSNISTSYLSISVATTVLLTLAICFRLLWMRKALRDAIGADAARPYLSTTAMLIESAFLYSVFALPHTVLLGTKNEAQFLTVRIIAQTQAIAPLLIIFRVAQGRAWSDETFRLANGTARPRDRDTLPVTSTMRFADPVGSTNSTTADTRVGPNDSRSGFARTTMQGLPEMEEMQPKEKEVEGSESSLKGKESA